MDDLLQTQMEQHKFNSVVIQLLLEIESRQRASILWLAQLASPQSGLAVVDIVNRIETASSEMRIESAKSLYAQFGQIHPDILDLLNPDK